MDTPRTIGSYRLVASLGEGGMAQVYLALSTTGFNKLMVVKVLRPSLDADEDIAKLFVEEARISARLNHPNVVQTFEAGNDGTHRYLAMEYLEGQPLSAIYRIGRAKVPLAIQLKVLCDLLEGLDYAHSLSDYDGTPLGLVHRDISPHNVIVTYAGVTKLLDFGIARVAGMTKTQDGIIKGKVGYMAPEQLTGTAVDARADIFGVGVMLWEALAQRRIIPGGESNIAAMSRRALGNDPDVRTVNPDANAELADIATKAMLLDAKARFASAGEMRRRIDAAARTAGLTADSHDVAAFLSAHFAEDRERLRKTIDEHIKSGSNSAPMLRIGTMVTSVSGSMSGDTPVGATATPIEHTKTPTPVPRRANLVRWGLVAAAVPAVAVIAFVALRSRTGDVTPRAAADTGTAQATLTAAPPAASTAAAPPATAAEAKPAAPATVRLRVRVTPTTASVTLDGTAATAPIDTQVPADGKEHTVTAKQVGYAPASRSLTATADQDITIELVPVRGGAGGRTPPPATTPTQAATGRGPKELDPDPYR